MTNHACLPDPRLVAEIRYYSVVHDASAGMPYYPAGRLAFNLGGAEIRLDGKAYSARCLFCITDDANMHLLEMGAGEIVVIDFRDGAFHRLFGLDGGEYGGSVVEASRNRFPQFNVISDALDAAPPTLQGRVEALDQALQTLLETARSHGLGDKLRFIALHTKGEIRVEDAAHRLGVSVRTLERECRMRFGRTPKRLLRLHRMRAAMINLDSELPPPAWADFDGAHFYCDQAHFLRDSRDFGGMTFRRYQQLIATAPDNWLYHIRGDFQEGGGAPYRDVKAEFEANIKYFPFGPEVAAELGLQGCIQE